MASSIEHSRVTCQCVLVPKPSAISRTTLPPPSFCSACAVSLLFIFTRPFPPVIAHRIFHYFFHHSAAGAVGINLTQANHVFLMEPCFNPALEAQAIGRVHRLGQKRAVTVTHLVMEDSVDTRIRKMLEIKYGSASATAVLDDDGVDDIGDEDKKPAAKPTALLGSIATDKATVLADEFDLLFGVETEGSSSIKSETKNEFSADEPVPDTHGSSGGGSGTAAWF